MPHIIIEHNQPHNVDIGALAEDLHVAASNIDAFPLGGLRVRAHHSDISFVGDGASQNGFIYILVRIGKGRDVSTQKDIGDRLFSVLQEKTSHLFERSVPLSLGLEIQEIEPDRTWKQNNLHELMKS